MRMPFNAALSPGWKEFGASLSEFSITVKSSPAARARDINALKPLRLGVRVGTTSYPAANSVSGGTSVAVYNTNVARRWRERRPFSASLRPGLVPAMRTPRWPCARSLRRSLAADPRRDRAGLKRHDPEGISQTSHDRRVRVSTTPRPVRHSSMNSLRR
jgi:hypothetical protein